MGTEKEWAKKRENEIRNEEEMQRENRNTNEEVKSTAKQYCRSLHAFKQ